MSVNVKRNYKTSVTSANNVPKCRARLDEWRASRGKVMRRPPIHALLGPQSKSEEQEFSAAETEKVNKTLSECLQLTEQVLGPLPAEF